MKRKKKKKQKKKVDDFYEFYNNESDEYFYYIAGYTPGGMPFGITWEEARAEGIIENDEGLKDIDEMLF